MWLMMISIRLLLCALIVMGAVVMSARGRWFVPLCFGTSSALIVLVPWTQQFPRYLVPMVPYMAVFLVVGGGFVAERSRRAGQPWDGTVRAVGVLLVMACSPRTASGWQGASAVTAWTSFTATRKAVSTCTV